MRKFLLGLALALAPTLAWGQCTGVFPANTLCGNLTGAARPPGAFSASGSIIGPASSTANGLPLWANTSGTQLQDGNGKSITGSYTWISASSFTAPISFTNNVTLQGNDTNISSTTLTINGTTTTISGTSTTISASAGAILPVNIAFGPFPPLRSVGLFYTGTISNTTDAAAVQLSPVLLGGTANTAYGIAAVVAVSAGSVTNLRTIRVENAGATGGGSITNSYGLWIDQQTGGSSINRSLYVAGGITEFVSGSTVGVGKTPSTFLDVSGPIATFPPATKATNYSMNSSDSSLIFSGSPVITLTLQSAATFPGRWLHVKTISASAVNSASSNVVPLGTAVATTGILSATAGKWAILQSDGTNWVIMAGN